MVRQTLKVDIPSKGLNTELTDLTDAPMYSKDELNIDILSDGTRARRLGLEYEHDYKLSAVAGAESLDSRDGQVTTIKNGFACYEWTNYKGDGQSLLVEQIGDKICFFKGINEGVLSKDEIQYQIDLTKYAIRDSDRKAYARNATHYPQPLDAFCKVNTPVVGTEVFSDSEYETHYAYVSSITQAVPLDSYLLDNGLTMVHAHQQADGEFKVNLPSESITYYTDTNTLAVGVKVYTDNSLEEEVGAITQQLGSNWQISNGDTVSNTSSSNERRLPSGYKTTPVSFASAYGALFICSPYIDVIRVTIKDGYKYTYDTQGSGKISISSLYGASWKVSGGKLGGSQWSTVTSQDNKQNYVFIYDKTGALLSSFYVFTYGARGLCCTTDSFCNAFNAAPSSIRQGFTVVGDGNTTYTFSAPSGMQYNGYKIMLRACTMANADRAQWWGCKGTHYGIDEYIDLTCEITGATTQGVTVESEQKDEAITPMVRDTSGIEEPGNPGNDEMFNTLTNEHFYNLLNQGWDGTYNYVDDEHCKPWSGSTVPTDLKIAQFYTEHTVYPSNALSWYALKDADGNYAPSELTNCALGSSLAPRGKMILEAYSMNRAVVSGVSPIKPSQFSRHRPEDICFFAGRLWYALDGRVLYSQIIAEDTTLVEKCYQAADPTSEDVSDPLDTDGGVMNIQQCGKILRLVALGSGLLIFGDKGVVAILPGNSVGFTPTSYYQQVVSSVGTTSKRAVISVGDSVYYWSALGVYRIGFNEQGVLEAANISFGSIHSFFKNLPAVAISNCVARFNSIKGDIHFMYPTNDKEPKRLNAVLRYNVNEDTWTPREIPLTEQASPFILDAIEIRNPIDTKPKAIIEANGETVTSNGSSIEILKDLSGYIGYDTLSYLVMDGISMKTTFANCTNIEHKDWTTGDIKGSGYNYDSYLTTHPYVFDNIYMNKQSPYVTTTFKRTEEGDLFKSGCFMSVRWDWAFSQASFKFDNLQQIYRPMELNEYKEYVMTKTRVRGSGKSLQLHFKNDGNKDFHLCAIGLDARGWIK